MGGIWLFYGGEVNDIFSPLLQTFIAQGSEGYLVHNVPLWFVSCLLVIEVMYYYVGKIKTKAVLGCCVCFAIVSFVMGNISDVFDFTKLPWSIGTAFAGIIFYAVGHILMTTGIIEKVRCSVAERKLKTYVILVFATVVLLFLASVNGKVSMGHETYGHNRLMFYLNGFLGIFCVIVLSIILEQCKKIKWINGLKWIGFNCLYFMFLENPIKGVVVQLFAQMLGINVTVIKSHFWYSIPAFVLTTFVTVVTVYVLAISIKKVSKFKTARCNG